MTLEDLGYDIELENYRKDNNLDSFAVGRVISEHKERYVVKTIEKEYDGEVIGNFLILYHILNLRVSFLFSCIKHKGQRYALGRFLINIVSL